jgi:hypothetical protein
MQARFSPHNKRQFWLRKNEKPDFAKIIGHFSGQKTTPDNVLLLCQAASQSRDQIIGMIAMHLLTTRLQESDISFGRPKGEEVDSDEIRSEMENWLPETSKPAEFLKPRF